MKVARTKDCNVIPHIKHLVDLFIENEEIAEYDAVRILQNIRRNIESQSFLLFIASDEKEDSVDVCGLAVGYITSNINDRLFLMISCFFGADESIEKAMLEEMQSWAYKNAIHEMMYITKNTKKFEEFGFKTINQIMLKEV
ncbi:MAG TPA: hypothetical protein VJ110_01040 [Candidatus Nanoarchaeia archaeon]|nr:hypothetical protein [Candidatus Nanoarchaeia archaeon]